MSQALINNYENELKKLELEHSQYAFLTDPQKGLSYILKVQQFHQVCNAIGNPEKRLRQQILMVKAKLSILKAMSEISKEDGDKSLAETEMNSILQLFMNHEVSFHI